MESSKPYSPWATHKYSRAKVEEIFGSKANGTVAQRLFKENPELYRELRAEAVSHGILENPRPNPWWGRDGEPKERTFTDAEIRARAEFSEEEVRALYSKNSNDPGAENVGQIAQTDPARYARLRTAAISYKVIEDSGPREVQRPPVQPPVQDDGKVAIGEELARKAHLPTGLRVDQSQLNKIVGAVAQVELARREAEKVAVEGDKVK